MALMVGCVINITGLREHLPAIFLARQNRYNYSKMNMEKFV
jgi:hypothetical protein